MPTVEAIYRILDAFAPFATAEGWDNCGLQLGAPDWEVTGCVVALDVTQGALRLAQERGANLIVTHHPIIFRPLRAIPGNDRICRMISRGIASISAHTNLDKAKGGVNDALFAALGLTAPEPFPNGEGVGRIGLLPRELTAPELAAYIKERLDARGVAFTEGGGIRRVAIGSGACGDLVTAARDAGADALITGEAKHSDYIDALNLSFPLFAAGHHDTEKVVLEPLRKLLEEHFPTLPCAVYGDFPVRLLA